MCVCVCVCFDFFFWVVVVDFVLVFGSVVVVTVTVSHFSHFSHFSQRFMACVCVHLDFLSALERICNSTVAPLDPAHLPQKQYIQLNRNEFKFDQKIYRSMQ